MSSISIALAPWSKTLSAALTRVEAGAFGSTMIFSNVETAASQERGSSDTDGSGGLFVVLLREQRGNGLLHLPAELCAMSPHLRLPAIICPALAPHRHSIAFSRLCRIDLLSRRTGVIHVVTVVTAKGEYIQ